jgi:hypothetical protein
MSTWTKVSERMPEGEGKFWVWLVPHKPQPSSLDPGDLVFLNFPPHAEIVSTWRDKHGNKRFNCGAVQLPTHWMPLPEPPCADETR